nr:hypothetical protein [Tanacetum cinerariifolium]
SRDDLLDRLVCDDHYRVHLEAFFDSLHVYNVTQEHSFFHSECAFLHIQLHVYLPLGLEGRKASLCSSTLPDLCRTRSSPHPPLPFVFDDILCWMSVSKRLGTDAVCYTKPLDSLKGWNDHFFWVDKFARHALFPWHTGKSVSRDSVPKSSEFNVEHYATLAAYPASCLLLCFAYASSLLSMFAHCLSCLCRNGFAFFYSTTDPTKVRIGEREQDKGEPKLLETTVGHVVPLLPVAPDRSSGELEASVDKLFDEEGSGEQADQGDSAGGGQGSAVQRLLAGAVQHAEVRGGIMPTFPFVSSFVSTTPEREGGDYTELLAGANLRTLEAPQRTFVPMMTNATTATPTANPAAIAKEKLVSASVFGGDSSSAGGSHPISSGFSDRTSGYFLVGGIRTVVDPDSNLQRVYVPHWNVTNGFCMDDGGVIREMVGKFALPKFFASIHGMEHDQLFTEFNVGAAHQISLGTEKPRRLSISVMKHKLLRNGTLSWRRKKVSWKSKVIDLAASVKVTEQEVVDMDAVVTSVKLQNDSLADQVHELEVASSGFQEKLSHYENLTGRLEEFQDAQLKIVNDKLEKLYADFVDMALHLEEKLTVFPALQRLQNINFSLLAELRSSKDASVDTIMTILRLEDNLAKRLGLTDSQPCVDQLMVPVHHSPDRVFVGATSLSFALDVSDAWVRKIRENITSQMPALRDVFTPISEPFSAEVLTGTEGTFDVVPAPITTALSVTSVTASTILPISTDDYEIAHTKGGEDVVADVEVVADEGADPFPDIALFKVADIPCSRKGVSIAVSKPVCSFAQCFRDFVWSLPLRSKLAPVFRMACFVVPVDKVRMEACVSDPGRSNLIPKASLFLTISIFVVLKVGMPISDGITASAPYVNENGVSPLLDLIMASVFPFYHAIGLGMLNGGEALADT